MGPTLHVPGGVLMFTIIARGFRMAIHEKRIPLLFYGINLVFAFIVMLPLRSALDSFGGGTFMGETLASRVDFDFLMEFGQANPTAVPSALWALAVVGVVYWLANLFLSGGAYATLLGAEGGSVESFWGNGARYFGRFVRL